MANIAFSHLAVPALVQKDLQVFRIGEKVGNLTFSFYSTTEADLLSKAKPAAQLNFNIYESDDRKTWGSPINSGLITVNPGGQRVVTVLSNKRFIKVAGYGTSATGTARLDIAFRGLPFFGDISIDVLGKSGFGIDGGNQPGVADYTASAWPQF